jgi:glutamate racemase
MLKSLSLRKSEEHWSKEMAQLIKTLVLACTHFQGIQNHLLISECTKCVFGMQVHIQIKHLFT